MVRIKTYEIPYFGSQGEFGITRHDIDSEIGGETIHQGYWGFQGGLTITETFSILEEAEEALVTEIENLMVKKRTKLERELDRVSSATEEFLQKGLSQYLVQK